MEPLVEKLYNPSAQNMAFNLWIKSGALASDGVGQDFTVTVSDLSMRTSLEVRYSDTVPFNATNIHRSLGTIPRVSPNIYMGTVEAVSMDGQPKPEGFLIIRQ